MSSPERITVFAPATVANVAVGFDVLGFAIDGPGDRVTIEKIAEPGRVEIVKIEGVEGLPLDPERNTATKGLVKLCRKLNPPFGFRVSISKGIPLGSGLGGSAASAAGAAVAASLLLDQPLDPASLLECALEGEAVASGSYHADNIAPCLFGGLNLVRSMHPPDVVAIPTPLALRCAVVHPDFRLDTREARGVLAGEVSLKGHIEQSANLGAFVAACFKGDLDLLGRSLKDVLIEPQRARLIPGFAQVKAAALAAGALGCSISGAGPTVFALTRSDADARRACDAMLAAFRAAGIQSLHHWVSPIRPKGVTPA